MKNIITHHARMFRVDVRDLSTGAEFFDEIALDKSQLQAAQLCGQSSKELIHRIYNQQGIKVLGISKPVKREIAINLTELYKGNMIHLNESGAVDE